MPGSLKKEYILVRSSDATPDSTSTTDFTLRLAVPIKDVVRTDLVEVYLDNSFPNIMNPDIVFRVGTGIVDANGDVIVTEYGIQPEFYTVTSLVAEVQRLLGPDYSVITVDGALNITYYLKAAVTAGDDPDSRQFSCGTGRLGAIMGLSESAPVLPTFNETTGPYGRYNWAFLAPVNLPTSALPPYLLIQSKALTPDVKVASGTLSYWRMVLTELNQNIVRVVNNRVDKYKHEPIVLQDIDIKVIDPGTGAVFDTRRMYNEFGGEFAMLLEIVRTVQI